MNTRKEKKEGLGRGILYALGTVLVALPGLATACPLCVDATPYKAGLQIAVCILLPLPFAAGFVLYRWLREFLSAEGEDSTPS